VTPAEKAIVDAAVRWAPQLPSIQAEHALQDAVFILLEERAAPKRVTQEVRWAEVAEGDRIYRMPNGAPAQYAAPGGVWLEVTSASSIGDRQRIHVHGVRRAIEPEAARRVTVQRGATGQAMDMFSTVLFSGPTAAQR
jgi:hypothetical protein